MTDVRSSDEKTIVGLTVAILILAVVDSILLTLYFQR